MSNSSVKNDGHHNTNSKESRVKKKAGNLNPETVATRDNHVAMNKAALDMIKLTVIVFKTQKIK